MNDVSYPLLKELTSSDVSSIFYNRENDYILMRLTSDELKIYSPGASSLNTITNSETLTTGPWLWNGQIQFLDDENSVQQIQDTA